jgi:hypothetical protein
MDAKGEHCRKRNHNYSDTGQDHFGAMRYWHSVNRLSVLLSRTAYPASCMSGFCNPACHHAPLKSDPRISFKDYHRNAPSKWRRVGVQASACAPEAS